MKYEKTRFFKPITSYLVSLNTKSIFFNVYYKTSLGTFQALHEKVGKEKCSVTEALSELNKLSNVFY
jgi:hypothetical protein